MHDFTFHAPATVAEAVALLKSKKGAKLLSGGQSLLPVLKQELAQYSDLVSLARVAELKEVRVDGANVVVGALCTHDQVARHPDVKRLLPALAVLAGGIGDAQVRHRGTLGGSVAHADPSADYPAALVALGATIKTDTRTLAADGYFTGLFETQLKDGEIITSVTFPKADQAGYAKFGSHASGFAVVGVFVAKRAGAVRVAVTGAGASVFRVPAMEAALAKSFTPAALDGLTVPSTDLISDLAASPEYRAHLVTVMAKRAVAAAAG